MHLCVAPDVNIVNKIDIVVMFLTYFDRQTSKLEMQRCPGIQTQIWKNVSYEQQTCCGGAAAERR